MVFNTLTALAELSYSVNGRGFGEVGQAPLEDGTWAPAMALASGNFGINHADKKRKRKRKHGGRLTLAMQAIIDLTAQMALTFVDVPDQADGDYCCFV